MTITREKLTGRADKAKPYVERAFRDEDVRENLKSALVAARSVYDELIGNRGVTSVATRVATDTEIHENLRTAIEDLREAAGRIQGKREAHTGRNLLLFAGILIGILYNPVTGEATRSWLRDLISGDQGEYEDQATTNSK
jgi:hypothetical protein